mgnify:CR=1 FL=1
MIGVCIEMQNSRRTLDTKSIIIIALFTAQALVLSIIENFIPLPVAIPGVKLGLANIIVLTVIILIGLKEALILVALRTSISSFFSGGFIVFLFSLAGGILSTIVMNYLYKKAGKVFSIVGISIAGAIVHNIGQLTMAIIVMKTFSVIGYLPFLLISGIITGAFVGLCANYMVRILKNLDILTKYK